MISALQSFHAFTVPFPVRQRKVLARHDWRHRVRFDFARSKMNISSSGGKRPASSMVSVFCGSSRRRAPNVLQADNSSTFGVRGGLPATRTFRDAKQKRSNSLAAPARKKRRQVIRAAHRSLDPPTVRHMPRNARPPLVGALESTGHKAPPATTRVLFRPG
jgi:hypothetical protein